eukprot:3805708-Pyramimonas_sp.AAC.1
MSFATICVREMQRDEEVTTQEAQIETAHHGATLAALASIWSKKGLFELKPGSSSRDNVYSILCEKESRRTSCAHDTAHASSAGSLEMNLYSCIFELQVDRNRRAGDPNVDVHRQWCQTEGSVYVNALWTPAAAMRGIWGKRQAREQVLDATGSGIARSGLPRGKSHPDSISGRSRVLR